MSPIPLRSVLIAVLLVPALAGCAIGGGAAAQKDASGGSSAATPGAMSSAVNRQVKYALSYWQHYNTAQYKTLGEDDCVNFTSQSLVARGWTQDDEWYYDSDSVYDSGAPWRSSTALRDYLGDHPEKATALDDTQRDRVVLGDIVQFDWDGSGDRDHTGIVTRVDKTSAGTKVYFAGHTEDSDYRDVDQAITKDHPGGTAYYWHLSA